MGKNAQEWLWGNQPCEMHFVFGCEGEGCHFGSFI
jgi:hypothetical protein